MPHYYDGNLVDNAIEVRDERVFSQHAELGQADTITVIVGDPDGTLDFVGYKSWLITEPACAAGNQVVWYGTVKDQQVSRGAMPPAGTAREWHLEIDECNNLLTRRVLTAVDQPDRPAETVDDRMAWLLTTTGFAGIIFDHGLIASSSLMLDANNYEGGTGADPLRDMCLKTGFNGFLRYREASADVELIFEDFYSATWDASSFAISNDHADHATSWYPDDQAIFRRSAQRIASGVYEAYPSGSFYDTNPTTAATYGDVDLVSPTASVKTLAAAKLLVAHLLQQHSEQDKRIICRIPALPAANLNDFLVGQLVSVKFTHFPGWETFRNARVALKAFSRPENNNEDLYDVDVELLPAVTPFTGEAFAALLDSNSSASGLNFTHTGDAPDSGWYLEPSVGTNLTLVQSGDPYWQIEAHALMSVRFEAAVFFSTVTSGDFSVSIYVGINGLVVGTGSTYSSSGGLRFESQQMFLDVHDLPVHNGDVIEILTDQPSLFWDGFTTNNTYLRVGRGTFHWDSGAVTWVGP